MRSCSNSLSIKSRNKLEKNPLRVLFRIRIIIHKTLVSFVLIEENVSNMKKTNIHKDLIIYQAKDGALEFKADSKKETIWLTQQQVAQLFDVQKAAISKHVKNIFDTKELSYQATVSKMETVQIEGERKIKRSVEYYNLDLVLSVGYRVNSIKATQFRQWATKTLRQHITKGYTINPKVIKNHYAEFQKAIQNIKQLLPAETNIDHASVLELISAFADT